jgi:hypothetical protein
VIARLGPPDEASATVPADVKGFGMRARLRFGLFLAVAATAIGISVPSASAGLLSGLLPACGATSHPFTNWGDGAGYCAFPNLGFESGSAGWMLSGKASVVSANEPWHVSGPGTHALQLGPGASALSSPLPVNLLDPYLRFFAHSAAANGPLHVQVLFRGLTGNLTGLLNFGNLAQGSYSSWQPTQRVLSTLALPLLTSTAQIQLTSQATAGSWQVDDAYLDPRIAKLG